MSTVIRGEVISSEYDDTRHSHPEHADAHIWAALIRQMNGWGTSCGDPSHVIDTPFRRANRLNPADECVLRGLARSQLAERRAAVTQ